jgi:GntR family transcriptional regulator
MYIQPKGQLEIGVKMNGEVVDKKSIIPIYYQLFKYFEKQIRQGQLQPGDALPTEMEIAERAGISRMTVRRAISELAATGMVYTQKGKGTFVAQPRLDNVVFNLNNYFDEIRQKGMNPHAELLETRIIKANEQLALRLSIEVNTRCLYFRILILADGEKLAYETKYTVYTKGSPILESELTDPRLSRLAAAHSDSIPSSSKKVLKVSKATEEEAKVLGISPGLPVFFMSQTIYDTDGKSIAWGKTIYRGDRYKLISYDGWNVEDIKE